MIKITKDNYGSYLFEVMKSGFFGGKHKVTYVIRKYTFSHRHGGEEVKWAIKRPGGAIYDYYTDIQQALAELYSLEAKVKKIVFEECKEENE